MAEDIQLLRQYAEHHAEDAFATLVERHISFVYSCGQLQAQEPGFVSRLGRPQDAQLGGGERATKDRLVAEPD
ncbi:MAG: hypothetical protein Q7S40_16150 [Opitutaceae bacterium]|nr:hypothetical protein [Opitutaceae bacterium]